MSTYRPYKIEFETVAGLCDGDVTQINLEHASDEAVWLHEEVHKRIFEGTPDGLLQLVVGSRTRLSQRQDEREKAAHLTEFLTQDAMFAHEAAATFQGIAAGSHAEIDGRICALNRDYKLYFDTFEIPLSRYTQSWHVKCVISELVSAWAFSSPRIRILDWDDWFYTDIYNDISGPTDRLMKWWESCKDFAFFDALDDAVRRLPEDNLWENSLRDISDHGLNNTHRIDLNGLSSASGKQMLRERIAPAVYEALEECIPIPTVLDIGRVVHGRFDRWYFAFRESKRIKSASVDRLTESGPDQRDAVARLQRSLDYGILPTDRSNFLRFSTAALTGSLRRMQRGGIAISIIQGVDGRLVIYGLSEQAIESEVNVAFRLLAEREQIAEVLDVITEFHRSNPRIFCVSVIQADGIGFFDEREPGLILPEREFIEYMDDIPRIQEILASSTLNFGNSTPNERVRCIHGKYVTPASLAGLLGDLQGSVGFGRVEFHSSAAGRPTAIAVYVGIEPSGEVMICVNVPSSLNDVAPFINLRVDEGGLTELTLNFGLVLQLMTLSCVNGRDIL
ncbi:hypothetical protein QO010_003365 [Caulobacter ginsengisoli]|uniref:Uncharacterized protein n=1 Tax=Caulobacter ginsengisoli TaxID=400775 RepID=A0ABU0IU90_9CAUL|nr:hypothetical protein [Caulobacter ginsengisoli]MDQ0465576.1 hypothetical protein [Caulobacter ginsengisoli]